VSPQQRIVTFVTRSNWLLLCLASAAGFFYFSRDVGTGIAVGGIIVTVNFHLLARTLKKALTPPHIASIKGVLIKYYIRFTITGIIIFVLMFTHSVNPIGLIAGLSVVVASMMLATVNEVRQILFKEAT
jgi:ATP synthase I chain